MTVAQLWQNTTGSNNVTGDTYLDVSYVGKQAQSNMYYPIKWYLSCENIISITIKLCIYEILIITCNSVPGCRSEVCFID